MFIDTKISTFEFVNVNFVKYYKLFKVVFVKFIKLRLINNKIAFNIIYMSLIKFQFNDHISEFWCFIIFLKKFVIILNMSWMKQHNSRIFFNKRFIIFDSNHCKKHCIHNYQFTTIYNTSIKTFFTFKSFKSSTNISKINVSVFIQMIIKSSINVIIMWFEKFEKLKQFASKNKYLMNNSFIIDVVVCNTFALSKR